MAFLAIPACLLRFIAGCPGPFLALCSLDMAWLATVSLLLALAVLPRPASAWNIPGHMLSAAIAYDVFQQESRQTIEKVEVVLEKHPLVRKPVAGETSKCSRCRP